MAEMWEHDRRQRDSLQRLEHSHSLAVERQREREMHRQTYQREAAIIQGENAEELMQLKHELDRENRLLDHAFARAEDAREVERLATEIAIRRRDDFIRHQWEGENGLFALEAKIIEMLAAAKLSGQQSAVDHKHSMEAKRSDQSHDRSMEAEKRKTMTHENELAKDRFEFEERLKQKIAQENRGHQKTDVSEILAQLNSSPRHG